MAEMKPLLAKKPRRDYRNQHYNSDILQYMEKEKYDALTSQLHVDSTLSEQRRWKKNLVSSTIREP